MKSDELLNEDYKDAVAILREVIEIKFDTMKLRQEYEYTVVAHEQRRQSALSVESMVLGKLAVITQEIREIQKEIADVDTQIADELARLARM